ncbi:1-deoxy-D-xylulose-5-phosphate synthase [Bifidobacterium leontopitheci]|uniref:1-deoxy-D-xylulose-5-phosphate synthase n=2 Tax=Bifidobacterium leontopitheci TaxID=2650774 RepID=A0A6I1GHK5_9BIFI|nr:1-deoxy-D-xylulose-5-phosphate synthase [Bifidobacterium leontopitheci]
MTAGILNTIHGPADVHALDAARLPELCAEIRAALIRFGHAHGGHIGSNLGMVEATVALHRVFDSPRDRIVFDVSHQSYVHKMITGRAAAYLDPAHFNDVTGFTNPDESAHDQFTLGHTGTSISLACGLAKTRDMRRAAGRDGGGSDVRDDIGNVIAVIGDGSLSSGIAFEGLNNAAEQGGNLIIVLNDNEMSIAGDFGGMYGPLARLRASNGTCQPNLFNALGLDYRYVEAGNDVNALVAAFREVKDIDHPVVVHIHTLKGAGLDAGDAATGGAATSAAGTSTAGTAGSATGIRPTGNVSHTEPWHSDLCNLPDRHLHEGQCEASHWQTPDKALGRPEDSRKHYGRLAMAFLERRFATEPGLVVISPATPGSNGITHEFRERAGSHYVDCGITEAHAVTFAAGIAKAGGTPVVATTASFFQRAYDQLFQEVSLNRSRITILDFLGGLSGTDNTHSGAYDAGMFANIPGMTMLAPTGTDDYLADLAWATLPQGAPGAPDGPVTIRVPGQRILDAERTGENGADRPLTADEFSRTERWEAPGAVWSLYDGRCRYVGPGESESADLAGRIRNEILSYRPDAKPADVRRSGDMAGDVAILALGNTMPLARRAAAALRQDGDRALAATVIDPRQCTELDTATLSLLRDGYRLVVTLEDGQLEGGWGEKVTAYYANLAGGGNVPRVLNFGAVKEFTDRVPLDELERRYGLTVEGVTGRVHDTLCCYSEAR